MNEEFWLEHDRKIRRAVRSMSALTLIAAFAFFLPFVGMLRPSGHSLGEWWQRSGAPVAVFAFLAQNKANYLGALITPGTFGSTEMTAIRNKYRGIHQWGVKLSIVLTVAGTLVWGYGDLLIEALRSHLS